MSDELTPEIAAELSEIEDAVLAQPIPSQADLDAVRASIEGSAQRTLAKMAMSGSDGGVPFDLTTPQGHVDAVIYVLACLHDLVEKVAETSDMIEHHELFSKGFELWEPLPAKLQYNVVLEMAAAHARLLRQVEGQP